MSNLFRERFASLRPGMRLFLAVFAIGTPALFVGHATRTFALGEWVGLSPAMVWKGEVWRILTYAWLDGGLVVWLIDLFWLFTLVSVLAGRWSSAQLWAFSAVAAIAGALPIIFIAARVEGAVVTAGGLVCALLVAWDRYYRHERIAVLGIGEMSVRSAAILIGLLNLFIVFFSCGGWLFALSLLCSAIAGWLYLALGSSRIMGRKAQMAESERIARLEL